MILPSKHSHDIFNSQFRWRPLRPPRIPRSPRSRLQIWMTRHSTWNHSKSGKKMALHLDRPCGTGTQAVCCIELVTEGRYTEILPRFSDISWVCCSQEITDLFQEENTSQLLSAVQDSMWFRFDIHVFFMGLAWFVPRKIWVVPPKPPFHLISWYWLGARSVRPWWWVKRLWTLGSGLVASCSCPWPHFFSDVSRGATGSLRMVQTFIDSPGTNLKLRRTTYLNQVAADRFQQNFFLFQRFSIEPSGYAPNSNQSCRSGFA